MPAIPLPIDSVLTIPIEVDYTDGVTERAGMPLEVEVSGKEISAVLGTTAGADAALVVRALQAEPASATATVKAVSGDLEPLVLTFEIVPTAKPTKLVAAVGKMVRTQQDPPAPAPTKAPPTKAKP